MELIRYDHDIIAWAKEQSHLVRTKQFDLLDTLSSPIPYFKL